MSDGMIIFLVVWGTGVLIFLVTTPLHYKRQPDDRLPMWATILIIVFWFIALPLALLILFAAWIDEKYFSDEEV